MRRMIGLAALLAALLTGAFTPNPVAAEPVAVAGLVGGNQERAALQADLDTCMEGRAALQKALDASREEMRSATADHADRAWNSIEAEQALLDRARAAEARVALLEAELKLEPTRTELKLIEQRTELEGKFERQLQQALQAQKETLQGEYDDKVEALQAEADSKLAAVNGEATLFINHLQETVDGYKGVIAHLHQENAIFSFQNGMLMTACLFLLCSILGMRHSERNTSTGNGVSTTKDDEQSQDRMARAHHLSALRTLCDRETARAEAAEDEIVVLKKEVISLTDDFSEASKQRDIFKGRAAKYKDGLRRALALVRRYREILPLNTNTSAADRIKAAERQAQLSWQNEQDAKEQFGLQEQRLNKQIHEAQKREALALAKVYELLQSIAQKTGKIQYSDGSYDITKELLEQIGLELKMARDKAHLNLSGGSPRIEVLTAKFRPARRLPNFSEVAQDVDAAPSSAARPIPHESPEMAAGA